MSDALINLRKLLLRASRLDLDIVHEANINRQAIGLPSRLLKAGSDVTRCNDHAPVPSISLDTFQLVHNDEVVKENEEAKDRCTTWKVLLRLRRRSSY